MNNFLIQKAGYLLQFYNLLIVLGIGLFLNQLLFIADFIFYCDSFFEWILSFSENLQKSELFVRMSNGCPYQDFIMKKKYYFEE